jgi:hypothetical protein
MRAHVPPGIREILYPKSARGGFGPEVRQAGGWFPPWRVFA